MQGGLGDFVQREVQVECMPTEIPEQIEIDISNLLIGQGIRLREVSEAVSWSPVSDPDTLLVHVIAPKVEEETPEDAESAEAPTDAVEGSGDPDGTKKGKSEDGDNPGS